MVDTTLGGGPVVHVPPDDPRWAERDDHGGLRWQRYVCAHCGDLGLARRHGIPPVGVTMSIHPEHSSRGATREQLWFCDPVCARDALIARTAQIAAERPGVADG